MGTLAYDEELPPTLSPERGEFRADLSVDEPVQSVFDEISIFFRDSAELCMELIPYTVLYFILVKNVL